MDSKCHDFDSFVLNFLDKDIIHEVLVFQPQYLYIHDRTYQLQVDFAARYENLAEDFKILREKLALGSRSLEVTNPSNKGDYRDYYQSREVREKVAWLYRKDFELLGYDPEKL